MTTAKLLRNASKQSSTFLFSADIGLMMHSNQLININKLTCTSMLSGYHVRTLSSPRPETKKKLKTYKDIPGPPGIPYLGNWMGFKNPETGYDPRHILKTGKHLWDLYGDMFRLEVPGKVPIIWYIFFIECS